jgi:uroporphyrinogen-III decarboxylase
MFGSSIPHQFLHAIEVKMNTREKFLANMAFEPGIAGPKWEYGYWAAAMRRWYNEGLIKKHVIPDHMDGGESVRAEVMGYKMGGFVDLNIHELFNLDIHQHRVPVDNFIYPKFEEEILEDHAGYIILRDQWGIKKMQKKDHSAPERFLEPPVKTMDDWEKLKNERLQADTHGRLPDNWVELVERYKQRDYPLILGGGQGFFGSPRYLLGDEEVLVTFITQPNLIHAINDHLCNMWITIYDRILKDIKPDAVLIWEDMCYKNGPLISPKMVESFMIPYYKRLCGFLKENGVKIIHVDTDGDARKVIPLFLEGGATGIFPLEVIAGMDVQALRESFPNLQLIGGVDKMSLISGKDAIDVELETKIKPTLKKGGFIPTVDHLVPPNVSWESFAYYRNRLNEIIDEIEA